MEYKPFISRVSDIYTGDIYTFENAYTYFSITPNHKLYVSRCHRGQKGNYKTLYDKDKKLIDGGVLETDIDMDSEEAIKDSLCFMDLDPSKLTWKELDYDLIEDFED